MATICDYCEHPIEGEKVTGTVPLARTDVPPSYVEGLDFHPECGEKWKDAAKKIKGARPEKEVK